MGDSISEGVIEEFVKNPGEFVEADEIIARIETDKVTVDITAPKAGVIEKYFAGVGDTVDVGADFYTLDTDAKGSSTPVAPKAAAAAAPTPAAEAPKQVSNLSLLNINYIITSVELALFKWLRSVTI
jgi:2-oxoglutarate dehydrogenase E2 component (dihydrolipoamide succinyltransferase)